jgi:hypothetical protein
VIILLTAAARQSLGTAKAGEGNPVAYHKELDWNVSNIRKLFHGFLRGSEHLHGALCPKPLGGRIIDTSTLGTRSWKLER